ncbi:MAG: methyl-accepting chemotaxis protein, partial [Selenomonadaceae bacterium]|nr:methyl-accepting chemotaxis protein [Selenomonadaceae bacterium]
RTVAEHAVSVADNANALSMVTSMAVERVADGRTSIQKIVASMETINESATKVQASISELARRSDEISNIVDLITGIAAQTNLLALNAAIEAARAGEQGKGFAVVADEVRKLAEESANSSQQIAALVARIQDEMNGAVEASRQSTESVASSIESVHEADGIFESIRLSIEALAGGIAEVSNNIGDISSGVQGMQKNADDISSISKENANRTQAVSATTEEQSASNQEIAAATRSLSELAEQLAAEVGKFKLS